MPEDGRSYTEQNRSDNIRQRAQVLAMPSWNPRAPYSDPVAGRPPHTLPRCVEARKKDRRHVRVRPPQLAEHYFRLVVLNEHSPSGPEGDAVSGSQIAGSNFGA